jgi:16S rRNA processing protein RimM
MGVRRRRPAATVSRTRAAGLATLGRIVGVFGVRGWIKVYSDTRPPEAILGYRPWRVGKGGTFREVDLAEGRPHGRGIVVRLEGCTDRDQAAQWVGSEIAVALAQLPPPKRDEYYWAQLEGLKVVNLEGQELGTVSHLFETGANDVLVVQDKRERLIPYTRDVIRKVDLDAGVLTVDWDASF